MILLDATAIVAMVRREPAALEVAQIIRAGDAAVSVVNLAEATDVLIRRHAVPTELLEGLAGELDVRPAALATARAAGLLRARHYHRTRRQISLADCFLIASAGADDEIATSDQGVADTAYDEGIALKPLPNSGGVKPRHRK